MGQGSNVLAEGNVFKNVKIQNNSDLKTKDGGKSFIPFRNEDSNLCTAALGRPCVSNLMIQSSNYNFAVDTQALNSFRGRTEVTQAQALPAASIQNGVPGSCGVGHV